MVARVFHIPGLVHGGHYVSGRRTPMIPIAFRWIPSYSWRRSRSRRLSPTRGPSSPIPSRPGDTGLPCAGSSGN